MPQVIAIVEFGRNTARTPFSIGTGKELELRVCNQILVNVKVVESNGVLWDLILEQFRCVNVEDPFKSWDLCTIDPNLDGATTY